ncbi:class II aldolase/adducin family protein [Beggiatoa leptomitoformis]|uniref:Class II aldolase/adducin family protein n=1 Tax=Beggiatoa leptomitoformis TaxID=288004 RepID=A0A2N9YHJ6_9GAMM|nr:class II aldolase/adducin family protein [Beggiatoa leptomitoformis]ALG67729.1 class II aldolase/adducin family protein [Beggiatoa leptomitoformis]AUI70031.1 class II aldolase/adducin family protein [Beggiatoa leptomitoformis]
MNLPEQLVQYYRWLRQYGINDSHSGNASVRDGETVWVTPTGACADTLQTSDLIKCNINEAPPTGASLDAPLHLEVYRRNSSTTAVLHSHGAHTVGITLSGDDFIPVDFEGFFYFPKVPVITIPFERYVSDSPRMVAEILTECPIMVVKGHGVYAHAKTLNLAYKWTCSLELSAKTYFIAQQSGSLGIANKNKKMKKIKK